MYKCLRCNKQTANRKDFKRVGGKKPFFLCNECKKLINDNINNINKK